MLPQCPGYSPLAPPGGSLIPTPLGAESEQCSPITKFRLMQLKTQPIFNSGESDQAEWF